MLQTAPINRIHVATVRTDDDRVLTRLDAYHALLDASERARFERLAQPADRSRFLIARALVRTLLSSFIDVPATAWRFVANEHGRPEIANPPDGSPLLRFNVSHTAGLVACAVTVGRDIGLDVESVNRVIIHDIAGRFFAPREVADLRALPQDRQPLVFFDYWTLKEAYIKARGLGLTLPLRHFAFALSDGAAPSISFDEAIADHPGDWQFHQAWPSPLHRLAVGIRTGGATLPVTIVPTIP